MPSATAAAAAPAAAASKPAAKPPRQSKIITLRITPDRLASFGPPTPTIRKQSRSKSTTSSSDAAPDPVVEPSPSEKPEDSNPATPAPDAPTPVADTLAPPPNPLLKRKGIPGPKPGSKRGQPQLTPDGLPKPRGKPGPKKKPRLDENGQPIINGTAPAAPSKLGPKANQGAINAGLRALDRSGKPCRRWEKKGFVLKSFTGVVWNVSTWRSPKKAVVDDNGDVKSDTTSTQDNKPENGVSAVPSEKSNGDVGTPNGPQPMNLDSSPAPVPAAA